MSSKTADSKTLVLGLGNVLQGDEGFGVEVARRLKELPLPAGVSVCEGGVGGFGLLGQLEGVGRLIVVDIMMLPSLPGELKLLRPGSELAEPGKEMISFHQVGALDLLQMWSLVGHPPETFFLVTTPQRLDWGAGLSSALARAVDKAVSRIREICAENIERSERPCTASTI